MSNGKETNVHWGNQNNELVEYLEGIGSINYNDHPEEKLLRAYVCDLRMFKYISRYSDKTCGVNT